jgi:hypothetical protein
MFGSMTATGLVAAATSWTPSLEGPVLIVAGLGVAFLVGNWIAGRFSKRGGGKRRRR